MELLGTHELQWQGQLLASSAQMHDTRRVNKVFTVFRHSIVCDIREASSMFKCYSTVPPLLSDRALFAAPLDAKSTALHAATVATSEPIPRYSPANPSCLTVCKQSSMQ
jgi:hypothetical protein